MPLLQQTGQYQAQLDTSSHRVRASQEAPITFSLPSSLSISQTVLLISKQIEVKIVNSEM